ncbi:hypothetical protein U1Q18_008147 [Sarracenia purpurea var. burkii]
MAPRRSGKSNGPRCCRNYDLRFRTRLLCHFHSDNPLLLQPPSSLLTVTLPTPISLLPSSVNYNSRRPSFAFLCLSLEIWFSVKMEQNGVISFRHRRSPSSDRFLDVFSPPKSYSAGGGSGASITGDELNEDEVFWTGDFTVPNRRQSPPSHDASGNQNTHRHSFRNPEMSGILAALAEDIRKPNGEVLYRKPSISSSSTTTSSSRLIPMIPKPPQEKEYSQSLSSRNFLQSAPMNVPMMPKKARNREFTEVDLDDDEDDEMLPPHEIVARGSAKSPKTTFSVLEGVGRTLKGRDLRQVRNAVWRKTGFLD